MGIVDTREASTEDTTTTGLDDKRRQQREQEEITHWKNRKWRRTRAWSETDDIDWIMATRLKWDRWIQRKRKCLRKVGANMHSTIQTTTATTNVNMMIYTQGSGLLVWKHK